MFAYFLPNKKTDTILWAFGQFLQQAGENVEMLEGDAGSEFINRKFKNKCAENNIKLVIFNKQAWPNAMAMVERANRT